MTTKAKRWLLPDGVDEILPPRAWQLETLRREILQLYKSWGYELIKTPLIEFLESLLLAPSQELQLSTFKMVDQLSGRSMGVRADISPQAARIDAHVLQQDGPARYCYADSVLKTRPQGPLGSRSPQLVGAELYGHSGIASDIEVISLMLDTLKTAGINNPLLALGHSRIVRGILDQADLESDIHNRLFTALQNKATADINTIIGEAALPPATAELLRVLPTLHGDLGILAQARVLFGATDPTLSATLDELQDIANAITTRYPGQTLYFDLCELRGYDYHTGVIFSAYVAEHGEAIANGGRYDDIGLAFGRSRAATGFDADLKTLLNLGKRHFETGAKIFAPAVEDAQLQDRICALRAEGECVVQALSGQQEDAAAMGCTRQLVLDNGRWVISNITD
jgi:ATP phosphoribosyltransferase regulatory subunit